MKKFMMLALSLSCVTSSIVSIQAANAEGYANSNGSYKVQKSLLQKSEWNTTPLEIQILDRRPTVRDFRTPDVQPNTLVIDAPPLPSVPGQTIHVGGGGGQGPASLFKAAPSNLMSLPKVVFGSESNANLSRANVGPLPDGTSVSSHVPLTMQQVTGHISPRERLANMPIKGTSAAAQPIAKYNPYKKADSGLSSSGFTVQTQARGVLAGRLKKE